MSKTDLRQSKWGNKKAIFQAMVYSLCMAMLCSSVAVHSLAAGMTIISVGQADGKPGETVTVAISLDANPGIAALSIKSHMTRQGWLAVHRCRHRRLVWPVYRVGDGARAA